MITELNNIMKEALKENLFFSARRKDLNNKQTEYFLKLECNNILKREFYFLEGYECDKYTFNNIKEKRKAIKVLLKLKEVLK